MRRKNTPLLLYLRNAHHTDFLGGVEQQHSDPLSDTLQDVLIASQNDDLVEIDGILTESVDGIIGLVASDTHRLDSHRWQDLIENEFRLEVKLLRFLAYRANPIGFIV